MLEVNSDKKNRMPSEIQHEELNPKENELSFHDSSSYTESDSSLYFENDLARASRSQSPKKESDSSRPSTSQSLRNDTDSSRPSTSRSFHDDESELFRFSNQDTPRKRKQATCRLIMTGEKRRKTIKKLLQRHRRLKKKLTNIENILVSPQNEKMIIHDERNHLSAFEDTRKCPKIKVRGHTRAPSGSREFIEATKKEALGLLHKELDKLLDTAPDSNKPQITKEFDGFSMLFSRFLEETGPSIDWDRIEKLAPGAVRNYETLETPTSAIIHNMLSKLVVVKLNGGLGTSMGCHGPKSVIAVRNDLTFLDLTVQQIENLNKTYKVNVPLVLMNSFNTDEDTQKVVRKYKNLKVEIHTFNQSCYPRINRDSLMPISKNCDITKDLEAWYPPGHGDFYMSFQNSGLLQKFLDQGKEWCFLSNIDNLGATVDLNILNLLLNSPEDKVQHEFVMEVTDKTKADVKGGTLIQYENKLRLLEIAQVPKEHVDDFKSVKSFKYFNTNNLWANLGAIDRVLKQNTLRMEIIINNKTLDNGLNVIQLETAVGAAMKTFEGGIGINVPRSRFLPVKKTSDLLLVMSNLYRLQNGSLVMSPQRMFPTTPLVKLGDNHFAKVKEFLGRFSNIPDLIELDHLTVSGDVTFGRGVSLKGTVIIIANHGDRIDIPSGANLENKIVSGNMRILDH